MQERFMLESVERIYDLDNGMYVELCPDDEGLGLIQLNCYDENNKRYNVIKFTPEQMPLLKQAIIKLGY